ncbi:MAG: hypothetical protein AVDCRST_MAG68-540 [uncultured Gemmatimonadetes bacterium]|uniref:Uncharacterized protein n=1 Tax=uncultured Gemmatimonadota bacterium TaxID=203437 RepID=A0A6J4K960_9BACT|nr:MAG: hypothetical protein AVDCRST_MAG68-540 [uncultured Gemmatimonadota bacterium]
MDTGNGLPPVARVREAVRSAVSARKLGPVAAEIGVTPMAVKYFLNGGEPRPSTRRKLEGWWVGEMARSADELDGAVEAAALTLLLRDLPDAERPARFESAVAYLEGVYHAAGSVPPPWLRALRAKIAAGAFDRPSA